MQGDGILRRSGALQQSAGDQRQLADLGDSQCCASLAPCLRLPGLANRSLSRARCGARSRPKACSRARSSFPFEDEAVLRAGLTDAVLNAIYEEDFLRFSYGFRPGRRPCPTFPRWRPHRRRRFGARARSAVKTPDGSEQCRDFRALALRLDDGSTLRYDTLVLATGARHAYFGHDDWEPLAPSFLASVRAFFRTRSIEATASSARGWENGSTAPEICVLPRTVTTRAAILSH